MFAKTLTASAVFNTFIHLRIHRDVLVTLGKLSSSLPGVCQGWRTWRPLTRVIPIWTTAWWWTAGAAAHACLCTLGLGTTETLMTCWTSGKWETRTANRWSWKSNQVCVEIEWNGVSTVMAFFLKAFENVKNHFYRYRIGWCRRLLQ